MKKSWIILGIIVVLILSVIGWFVSAYNKFQQIDESVNNNWAQVQNQLQRRADLIPNLVSTVKGYASHEKTVYLGVAEARAKLAGAAKGADVKAASQANSDLSNALSRLLVVVENYPQLKANENFRALQDELAGTENRIAVARKDYNDSVRILNSSIRMFPGSVIAGIAGIKSREYFQVEPSKTEVPDVKF